MPPHRRAAAAILVAVALGRSARADTSVQATGTLSGAWTDSPTATSATSASGTSGPGNDVYADLRANLLLGVARPRYVLRIGYDFDGSLHFVDLNTNGYLNRVQLSAAVVTSPRTNLTVGFVASYGAQNQRLTSDSPERAPTDVLPAGNPSYFNGSLLELLTFEVSARWRVVQSLKVDAALPVEPTVGAPNVTVAPTLHVEHLWQHDSLGGDAGVSLALLAGSGATGVMQPAGSTGMSGSTQLISRLLVVWRHDLGTQFVSLLRFGVEQTIDVQNAGQPKWVPAGQAQLSYTHPLASAMLDYNRTMTPDVLTGQLYATDSVFLRARIPLFARTPVILAAAVGYQHAVRADDSGSFDVSVDTINADVGLIAEISQSLSLTARYTLVAQLGDVPVTDMSGQVLRNFAMVGLSVRIPSTPFRVEMPRAAVRVDQRDAVPFAPVHTEQPPADQR
jgi:hypothetical protein